MAKESVRNLVSRLIQQGRQESPGVDGSSDGVLNEDADFEKMKAEVARVVGNSRVTTPNAKAGNDRKARTVKQAPTAKPAEEPSQDSTPEPPKASNYRAESVDGEWLCDSCGQPMDWNDPDNPGLCIKCYTKEYGEAPPVDEFPLDEAKESLRIQTKIPGHVIVLNPKKNDSGEFVVNLMVDGRREEDHAYYTNDWEDAVATAKAMAAKLGEADETPRMGRGKKIEKCATCKRRGKAYFGTYMGDKWYCAGALSRQCVGLPAPAPKNEAYGFRHPDQCDRCRYRKVAHCKKCGAAFCDNHGNMTKELCNKHDKLKEDWENGAKDAYGDTHKQGATLHHANGTYHVFPPGEGGRGWSVWHTPNKGKGRSWVKGAGYRLNDFHKDRSSAMLAASAHAERGKVGESNTAAAGPKKVRTGASPVKNYIVFCHHDDHSKDGFGDAWEKSAGHKRSTSKLIGNPKDGALWHCPKHHDCKTCRPGSWTDSKPGGGHLYTEAKSPREAAPFGEMIGDADDPDPKKKCWLGTPGCHVMRQGVHQCNRGGGTTFGPKHRPDSIFYGDLEPTKKKKEDVNEDVSDQVKAAFAGDLDALHAAWNHVRKTNREMGFNNNDVEDADKVVQALTDFIELAKPYEKYAKGNASRYVQMAADLLADVDEKLMAGHPPYDLFGKFDHIQDYVHRCMMDVHDQLTNGEKEESSPVFWESIEESRHLHPGQTKTCDCPAGPEDLAREFAAHSKYTCPGCGHDKDYHRKNPDGTKRCLIKAGRGATSDCQCKGDLDESGRHLARHPKTGRWDRAQSRCWACKGTGKKADAQGRCAMCDGQKKLPNIGNNLRKDHKYEVANPKKVRTTDSCENPGCGRTAAGDLDTGMMAFRACKRCAREVMSDKHWVQKRGATWMPDEKIGEAKSASHCPIKGCGKKMYMDSKHVCYDCGYQSMCRGDHTRNEPISCDRCQGEVREVHFKACPDHMSKEEMGESFCRCNFERRKNTASFGGHEVAAPFHMHKRKPGQSCTRKATDGDLCTVCAKAQQWSPKGEAVRGKRTTDNKTLKCDKCGNPVTGTPPYCKDCWKKMSEAKGDKVKPPTSKWHWIRGAAWCDDKDCSKAATWEKGTQWRNDVPEGKGGCQTCNDHRFGSHDHQAPHVDEAKHHKKFKQLDNSFSGRNRCWRCGGELPKFQPGRSSRTCGHCLTPSFESIKENRGEEVGPGVMVGPGAHTGVNVYGDDLKGNTDTNGDRSEATEGNVDVYACPECGSRRISHANGQLRCKDCNYKWRGHDESEGQHTIESFSLHVCKECGTRWDMASLDGICECKAASTPTMYFHCAECDVDYDGGGQLVEVWMARSSYQPDFKQEFTREDAIEAWENFKLPADKNKRGELINFAQSMYNDFSMGGKFAGDPDASNHKLYYKLLLQSLGTHVNEADTHIHSFPPESGKQGFIGPLNRCPHCNRNVGTTSCPTCGDQVAVPGGGHRPLKCKNGHDFMSEDKTYDPAVDGCMDCGKKLTADDMMQDDMPYCMKCLLKDDPPKTNDWPQTPQFKAPIKRRGGQARVRTSMGGFTESKLFSEAEPWDGTGEDTDKSASDGPLPAGEKPLTDTDEETMDDWTRATMSGDGTGDTKTEAPHGYSSSTLGGTAIQRTEEYDFSVDNPAKPAPEVDHDSVEGDTVYGYPEAGISEAEANPKVVRMTRKPIKLSGNMRTADKFHTCPECEANFKDQDGVFPQHRGFNTTELCLGSGQTVKKDK